MGIDFGSLIFGFGLGALSWYFILKLYGNKQRCGTRRELHQIHADIHRIISTQETIMASNAQLEARLTSIEAKMDEASTEITTELQRLRDAIANTPGAGSSPEVDAIIDRLETKANALADVGNAPPTP